MRQIVFAILTIILFSGIGLAQDNSIDNQVWQIVEQGDYRFRLPATWQNVDNTWQHPDLLLTITLETNNPDGIDSPILIDESVELPLAESRKITFEQDGTGAIAYIINHQERSISLAGTYPADLDDSERTTFLRIIEQAANTLESTTNENTWLLTANTDSNLFLRIPANWMRENTGTDSMTVSELFGDSSVALRYRDLGRPFQLEEIEEQFVTIYNSNSYDIQEQGHSLLPAGEALFFRLGNVRVTSEITHTQLHYIIARGNYMILIVAGADERYFAEYESLLIRMVDTMTFNAP